MFEITNHGRLKGFSLFTIRLTNIHSTIIIPVPYYHTTYYHIHTYCRLEEIYTCLFIHMHDDNDIIQHGMVQPSTSLQIANDNHNNNTEGSSLSSSVSQSIHRNRRITL